MANPTTYFGWVMPTATDLVTDLPADFNVFGQGVDTSMQYLLGGTTGQVLSKTSATNMAFTWTTPTDQVPLTTKGDLFTFTTVDARLAVGTDKYVLGADSAQATGLAWQTSPQSVMTTTGDILYASAANTPARLGIGTTGQNLVVASGVPSWATPAGGGKVLQVVQGTTTSQTSVASTTYTATTITANITPSLTSSKVLVFWSTTCTKAASTASGANFRLMRGATALTLQEGLGYDFQATGNRFTAAQNYLDSPSTTSSTTYAVQFATFSGTDAIYAQVSSSTGTITLMEIGA